MYQNTIAKPQWQTRALPHSSESNFSFFLSCLSQVPVCTWRQKARASPVPTPQSKQVLVGFSPQLTQISPLHHRLRRAWGCWGAPAAGTAGLGLAVALLCSRVAPRGVGTVPTGSLQVPEPLPVGPPRMDGQADKENLLSLQQEHKKTHV